PTGGSAPATARPLASSLRTWTTSSVSSKAERARPWLAAASADPEEAARPLALALDDLAAADGLRPGAETDLLGALQVGTADLDLHGSVSLGRRNLAPDGDRCKPENDLSRLLSPHGRSRAGSPRPSSVRRRRRGVRPAAGSPCPRLPPIRSAGRCSRGRGSVPSALRRRP